jgi:hypothetical protein
MIALLAWAWLGAVPLPPTPECHTQGMKVLGGQLLVSCVDKSAKRALLYQFAWPNPAAAAPVVKDLTPLEAGRRYHPSGLDLGQGCLWLAVAEYRPRSSARVYCLDPATLAPRSSFEVKDHIGALAAPGDRLVGLNWDSREIYLWDASGRELDHGPSRLGAAYQDCKALDPGSILCSGLKTVGKLFFARGVVDRIQVDPDSVQSFRLLERRVIRERSSAGHLLTREAMDFYRGMFYFIPDDFPGAEVYSRPGALGEKQR